jgi:nitroreductase
MERNLSEEVKPFRKPTHDISPIFLNRWSPRAMTGESLADDEFFSLFEAARWAPSSYNNQSWRFIYAKRDTPAWKTLFGLLVEFNRSWCKNAAALVVIISKATFDHNGKPARTHSFDTGAAWMSLALEGSMRGLVVHGMEGFDYEKAKKALNIPDGYQVEAMCAIGKRAPKDVLPQEMQEREQPSGRKPLKDIAWEGTFRG